MKSSSLLKAALLFTAFTSLSVFAVPAHSATLPVEPGQFPCLDAATADRYIRDFSIDIASFGGRELCDSRRESKMLLDAITLLEQGEFATGGQNVFLQNFLGSQSYYAWMKNQTRGMNRGNDIPTATAYNRMGYFTLQDGWAILASLGKVSVLVHEARHTEGYSHIPCTFGPYKGVSMQGCDRNLRYGGSHGVEMEYYAKVVVQGKNFHPAYASMARMMAMGRSNFVFNETPIRTREGLALIESNTQQLYLVDGDQVHHRAAPLNPRATLKRTSFGASLYERGIQNAIVQSIDLYSTAQGGYSFQDDYSYYKMLRRPDRLVTSPLDAEELDISGRRYFVAINPDRKLYSFVFGDGAWSRPTAPVADASRFVTVTPSGKTGLFVVTTDGTILPFNPLNVRVEAALNERWPSSLITQVKAGNSIYGLETDGVVYTLQNGQKTPVPFLMDRRFSQMVSIPLYDIFEVAL